MNLKRSGKVEVEGGAQPYNYSNSEHQCGTHTVPGTVLHVLYGFTPITYEVNNCDYYPMSHGKSLNGAKQGKEIRLTYENPSSGSCVEH